MPYYAQTIIQLYNQLQDAGYSNSDLIIVRNTYNLAMSIFSCHFQPSGKTFIAHGVGVASILASLKQPAHLTAAGLIHNIYFKGDFGSGTRGISGPKRKYIRKALGKEIEEYAARFATMRFNSEKISAGLDDPSEVKQIDREVILMYLADHLEHLLDQDILYYNHGASQRYTRNSMTDAEIAIKLGFPALASEIKRMAGEAGSIFIPEELVSSRTESYTLPPKSYTKRLPAIIAQKFNYIHSKIKIRKILGLNKN